MDNRWVFVIFSYIWTLTTGVDAMCDAATPTTETAYAGEDKIYFPGTFFKSQEPAACRWLISAYRKGHVVHLDFDDVILERNYLIGSCVEEISVYDGPEITNTILASFCGREEPRLVTSSRETLVVFSSNNSSLDNGTFTLRYRAVKDRHETSGDTAQVLRTAFGAFIGVVACIVIFSWAFRKYKRPQQNRRTLATGRPRITTSCGNGLQNECASARNGDTRVTSREPVQPRQPGRLSFKNKISGLFQEAVLKLSPRRMTVGSIITVSNNNSCNQRQSRHTNCCHGQPPSLCNASIRNSNSRELYPPNIPHNLYPATGLDDFRAGHVTMNYPNVPLSSFTSDPDAVRPPKYEDCLNGVQPVYLHHNTGNTFYNRAFNLKDEEPDIQIFSPPPPYSEIGQEIPSLGAASEGATHQAWMLPCQQPPNYEVTSIGAVATSDLDIAGYDYSERDQSCDRGETLIHVTAMQNTSVIARPLNSTNHTTRLHPCDTLTAEATVQLGSTIELVSNAASNSPNDDDGISSANSITSEPSRQTSLVSGSSTVTPGPCDLQRTGFLSLETTDGITCMTEEGRIHEYAS